MIDPSAPEAADPSDWHLGTRVVAMPADANAHGDIFGGWLMSQADVGGSIVAIRAARGRVATVAVKELKFLAPVLVGDLVDIYARVRRIGRTSVTVEVQAWAQGDPNPASRRQVAQAQLVYVALDERGRPRAVPHRDPSATP